MDRTLTKRLVILKGESKKCLCRTKRGEVIANSDFFNKGGRFSYPEICMMSLKYSSKRNN